MAKGGQLRIKVLGDASGVQKAMRDTDSALGGLTGSIGKVMGALGGLYAVKELGTTVLRTAADFEQGMSDIAAVTGSTASEMEQLRQIALQLGKDTAFSAGEAAAGISELAKAGVSVTDIMGGGVAGTLDLAAAGGLEVAEAATIASNAMNQFGLAGKDVAQVADALAMAANVSSADVTDLGQALAMCGTVTAQAGWSFQETSAALAILANQGMKGSDAGTSLKQMLMKLQAPAEKAAEVLESMGIALYDANGEMKSAEDIIGLFASATKKMTDEERDFAMATIFGSDAVRAANILVNQGADAFGKMTDEMSEAGTAQEMAAKKLDNFKGSMEQLKGSLETLMIAVGTPLMNALRPLVDWATEGVNDWMPAITDAVTGFFDAVTGKSPEVGSAFSGIGTILGGLRDIFTVAWPIMRGVVEEFVDFLKGPTGQQLIDDLLGLVGQAAQLVQEVFEKVWPLVKGAVQAFIDFLNGPDGQKLIDTLFSLISTALEAVQTVFETVWPIVQGLVQDFIDWFSGPDGQAFISGLLDAIGSTLDTLKGAFKTVWEGIKPFIQDFINWFDSEEGQWLIQGLLRDMTTVVREVLTAFTEVFSALAPMLGPIVTTIVSVLQPILTILRDIIDDLEKIPERLTRIPGFNGQAAGNRPYMAIPETTPNATRGWSPSYAHGGLININGGSTTPLSGTEVPIIAHAGEYVLTVGDTNLMQNLIGALTSRLIPAAELIRSIGAAASIAGRNLVEGVIGSGMELVADSLLIGFGEGGPTSMADAFRMLGIQLQEKTLGSASKYDAYDVGKWTNISGFSGSLGDTVTPLSDDAMNRWRANYYLTSQSGATEAQKAWAQQYLNSISFSTGNFASEWGNLTSYQQKRANERTAANEAALFQQAGGGGVTFNGAADPFVVPWGGKGGPDRGKNITINVTGNTGIEIGRNIVAALATV